jgi:hypothetical protein
LQKKGNTAITALKLVKQKPTASLILSGFNIDIPDISFIFSAYHSRIFLTAQFGIYCLAKSIPENTTVTRGLLLDFLAYSDGYPSWENFEFHHKSNRNSPKTYIFSYDASLEGTYPGGGMVKVFTDPDEIRLDQKLANPSWELNNCEPIGYSWGYYGSGVKELAQALLYSVDPMLVHHANFLAREYLYYFPENSSVELIVSGAEIKKFIQSVAY